MQNEASSRRLPRQTISKDGEGFRRLAKASLSKAIDDAVSGGSQEAYSAIRWLAGNTTEGMTFEACCELIGISPPAVRRSLRRRYKPIRMRFGQYKEVNLRFGTKPRNRSGGQRASSS